MTGSQTLLFDLRAGVGAITFNRPNELNAVNPEMARAMAVLALKLPEVRGMKAIVLQGSGNHFMAGGDIAAFRGAKRDVLPVITKIIDGFHAFVLCLQELPQPVVSLVRGAAAGGGFSLAIGADIIVAGETAKFTPAYRKLGTTPDGGGSFFLPRIVGARKAMEMLLAGGTYTAREAEGLGLVNCVAADSALERDAGKLLAELVANSAPATAAAKRLLKGHELPALRAHLEAEKVSFLALAERSDFSEGVEAFMAKRAPKFAD